MNLFDDFGVDAGSGKAPLEPALPLTALQELQALADTQAAIGALPHVFDPAFLNAAYLARVLEVSRRLGKFTYICARCYKPIHDSKKLVHDRDVRLIFGTDCHAMIQRKQLSLQLVYGPDGRRQNATAEQLTSYSCLTTGHTFKAHAPNVQHCGTTPRVCAVCPGTGLRYKNVPCNFERWHRGLRTR